MRTAFKLSVYQQSRKDFSPELKVQGPQLGNAADCVTLKVPINISDPKNGVGRRSLNFLSLP
jgi:hypothetical protein